MSLELFRCRICGEVYFGSHPSHCPYCGVHGVYLIHISDWKNENLAVTLTDISKKNLETTLKLEFNASRLYRASAKKSKSDEIQGYFKYLARVEKEHYEVVCKLLGVDISDEINGLSDDVKDTDVENLSISQKLEEAATKLYRKFSTEAKEPRVKDFFKALSDVEADHTKLDIDAISKLNKGAQ